MDLDEFLKLERPSSEDHLSHHDLVRFFWKYKAILKERERDNAFWQSTNKSIERAYTAYQTLAENLPAIVYRAFAGGSRKTQFFNNMAESITGCTVKELPQGEYHVIHSLVVQGDRHRITAEIKYALDQKKSFTSEYRITHKDGSIRHLLEKGTPIFDADGLPIYIDGLIFDITERKHMEEDLRKHMAAMESSIDGMAILSEDGRYRYMNDAHAGIYGYDSPRELIGKKWEVLYSDEETRRFEQDIVPELREKGRWQGEAIGKRKNGSIYPQEVSLTLIEGGELVCVVRDISDRKNAEEALREANNRLNAILQASPAAIYTLNTGGIVTLWNRAAEKMFGWSEKEAVGSLLPIVPEDKRGEFRVLCEKILKGESFFGTELRRQKKNGLPVDISVSAAPLYDSSGRVNGIMAVVIDITARKRMEEELLKNEKLESLGILAGGIAHDFNNLLAAIMGNISLAKMYAEPHGKEYQRLVEAEKASTRAKALTQQLLTFSKGGGPIKKVISLRGLINESASFVLSGSQSKGEIIIPDDLWPVEADEGQISQVIHNFMLNAAQSMPRGGIITLRCKNVTLGAEEVNFLKEGNYVEIAITDEGIGIPEEYLEKIFDPYFTTKEEGRGLGLTTSYSIIKKHGGHIFAESARGAGTTFRIYLPASESVIHSEKNTDERLPEGKGRILIMEDEEIVSAVAGEMLKKLGYEVEFSKDGSETISRYRRAKESNQPFDIVIMDLTIPGGMGGEIAIRRLLELDPHVKAIVSSGYSNHPVMANFEEYGFKGVLAKPYKLKELSDAVSNVLGRCRG